MSCSREPAGPAAPRPAWRFAGRRCSSWPCCRGRAPAPVGAGRTGGAGADAGAATGGRHRFRDSRSPRIPPSTGSLGLCPSTCPRTRSRRRPSNIENALTPFSKRGGLRHAGRQLPPRRIDRHRDLRRRRHRGARARARRTAHHHQARRGRRAVAVRGPGVGSADGCRRPGTRGHFRGTRRAGGPRAAPAHGDGEHRPHRRPACGLGDPGPRRSRSRSPSPRTGRRAPPSTWC